MSTLKYVLQRLAAGLITLFCIALMCFVLIKLLQPEASLYKNVAEVERIRREALGYDKPIMVQFGIYLKNIVTEWDWGTSWKIHYMQPAMKVVSSRLLPSVLVNLYSIILAEPLGILLGIWAALKKNKPTDYIISTAVMIFVSVPTYVYAFVLQYFIGFKLGLFPLVVSSVYDAGGSYFTWTMLKSQILPVLALSFGIIAGQARFTRAELTEALTSEYMLLARTKGLTRAQATTRHALRNAMVPILPGIISDFLSILGGSIIIEQIFSIPGVGKLYLQAVNMLDYDVFMVDAIFYAALGIISMILVDLSYGFIDPRVRMGAKKSEAV